MHFVTASHIIIAWYVSRVRHVSAASDGNIRYYVFVYKRCKVVSVQSCYVAVCVSSNVLLMTGEFLVVSHECTLCTLGEYLCSELSSWCSLKSLSGVQ